MALGLRKCTPGGGWYGAEIETTSSAVSVPSLDTVEGASVSAEAFPTCFTCRTARFVAERLPIGMALPPVVSWSA